MRLLRLGPGRISGKIAVLATLIAYGVPAYFIVATSLRTTDEVFAQPFDLVFKPSLASYTSIDWSEVVPAAWSSVRITLLTTAIVLVLGVPAAYALARARGRWRGVGLGAVIVLQLLPASSLVIPLYEVLQTWGMLGRIEGVIVASSAYFLPFGVILLRPFFLAIPMELETAAAVDGASRVRIFVEIVLPLARNGIITVAVLVAMIVWGDFLFALTLLVDPNDYPLPTLLAQQVGTHSVDWPGLMALAIVVAVPVIAVFLVFERRLVAGLSAGGVK
jgi:multiple sugar transport system permease protein